MTNDSPLSRKVSALVGENTFVDGAMNLGPSGDANALGRLLHAIDDTMMLRDAVFSVGDSALTLRISGKRVLRVVAATADLECDDLTGKPLSTDDQVALADLAAGLRKLTGLSGTLTLARAEVDSSEQSSGSGVGMQSLGAALEAGASTDGDVTEDAMALAVLPLAQSMVQLVSGKVEALKGDKPKVVEFQSLIEADWLSSGNSLFTVLNNSKAPALQVLDSIGADGEAVAGIKTSENQYFATISESDTPKLMGLWAALVQS